jgi:DNA repair protein RadC
MNAEKPDNDDQANTRAAADAEPTYGPRERLAAHGPQHLADADLLAVILGQPSLDTPHRLLATLGGLRGIAQATDADIQSAARGVGPVRAAMIRAAIELGRRSVGERPQRGRRLGCASDIWTHYRARLASTPFEEFWAISLDARHRIIGEHCVARGSLTGVEVHPREVFRPLIRESAAAVLLCHNHPSGDPTPSRQDIELTTRLREVGSLCGIEVLDHVVVAAEGFISLADRGWL